jgi:hypothetical protein
VLVKERRGFTRGGRHVLSMEDFASESTQSFHEAACQVVERVWALVSALFQYGAEAAI